MIYKVLDSTGNLVRSGVCQETDLELQARPGETASEATEEELAPLKVAAEPIGLPARERPIPLDSLTVLIRALQNEGVTLDLQKARAELTEEIATKRTQAAVKR